MESILITGGSGTFGRAFIRQALFTEPDRRIVSLSRDEQKVAALTEEFSRYPGFRAFVGDVRDRDRLRDACRGIETVIMAAALKRVDVTAYNPDELLKTNVLGVDNTIRAAADANVRRVLLISSDKAVSPSNSYGTSKLMAENIAVSANVWAYPRGMAISALRYGNVLGSRGSVLGIWQAQIARGEPITMTDVRMSRFMLTIEEGVQWAMRALRIMRGGEIFIPRLPSFSLATLAEAIMPRADYPYVQTGLRPGGEKIAEALLNEEEPSRTVRTGDLYTVTPSHHEWTKSGWDGEPIGDDFVYRSDVNDRWLTVEEIRSLISSTEAMR